VSKSSAQQGNKNVKNYAYIILQPYNNSSRVGSKKPPISWIGAYFTLYRNVNNQNNRHQYSKNTHAVYAATQHDLKVGAWCAVRVLKIRGSMFYK
jgi:hypothetical protein